MEKNPINFCGILLIVFLFTFSGCGSDDTDHDSQGQEIDDQIQQCREIYSPENGYDFEPQFAGPEASEDYEHLSPEQAEQECNSDQGDSCDADSFITMEAAKCIAQAFDFEPGLEDWTILLQYRASYKTVVWYVENLIVDAKDGKQEGKALILHGTTGQLIETLIVGSSE